MGHEIETRLRASLRPIALAAGAGALVVAAIVVTGMAGTSSAARTLDPAVAACEAFIQHTIKTPSTYRAVRTEVSAWQVSVDFDAQNENGALIRQRVICSFSPAPGVHLLELERPFDDDWNWHLVSVRWNGSPRTIDALTATFMREDGTPTEFSHRTSRLFKDADGNAMRGSD